MFPYMSQGDMALNIVQFNTLLKIEASVVSLPLSRDLTEIHANAQTLCVC